MSEGVTATSMPHSLKTAILAAAVSSAPPTIAPAWPMRRPAGAVAPAPPAAVRNRSWPWPQSASQSLLATLMLIKAEALENEGRVAEAKALRLDSLGWARYGFGSERQVRARMGEIALLGARGHRG